MVVRGKRRVKEPQVLVERDALSRGEMGQGESIERPLKHRFQSVGVGHQRRQELSFSGRQWGVPSVCLVADHALLGGFAIDISPLDFEKGHTRVLVMTDSNLESRRPSSDVVFQTLSVYGVEIQVVVPRLHMALDAQNLVFSQILNDRLQPCFGHHKFGVVPVHERHTFDGIQTDGLSLVEQVGEIQNKNVGFRTAGLLKMRR
jgi:hypothetical protein